jgi:branched-chain amino acid transport system ATP-binding protein
VSAGEILGLIGPNGAGKTTVFNLVTGFLRPTSGEIRLAGESVVGLRPHAVARRGLARTFQIVKPFQGLTVLENVRVGALARTATFGAATRKAREVLALVGLEDRADRTARGLTLADRKRLELARALATEPRLLLLDEVMAGLTPTETERLIEICRAINARGIAILLIEHVMRAVMSLSRRVVVLSQGQVLAAGSPDAIARDPQVVEAYLGEAYGDAVEGERAGA